MTSDDDFKAFAQEMGGIKPIKTKPKQRLAKQGVAEPSLLQRRQMAVELAKGTDNHLSEEIIDLVHPLDYLEYSTNGVSFGVFRKLKRGEYSIDARLDLHRKSMAEARRDVFQFVKDCKNYSIRTAMVIHGKGQNSQPKAFLKSCVNTWLRQLPDTLAFCSAQKHHGGVGALYVLIKKSDQRKQENKLHFSKGRVD